MPLYDCWAKGVIQCEESNVSVMSYSPDVQYWLTMMKMPSQDILLRCFMGSPVFIFFLVL